MTARLQDGHPKTILTVSATSEQDWLTDRRRATVDRRHAADREIRYPLHAGGPVRREYGYVVGERGPELVIPINPIPPRRIDWYRVAALLIVAGAASLTAIGLWAIGVYVLTAF
jgi:hypothetical protein